MSDIVSSSQSDAKRSFLTAATTVDGRAVLTWGDGNESRFHFLWLRDNCRCKDCGERAVGQKLTYLFDLPVDVAPTSSRVDDSGWLAISWNDGHDSRYDPAWLRDHCYSESARNQRRHQPRLWDAGLMESLPSTTWEASFSDQVGHHRLLTLIRDYGFALVRGVPGRRDAFERMVRHIGFPRETNYGIIGELVTEEVALTLSSTRHAIRLHTDEGYRHMNPGMLAFQCLATSEDGQGATLLADGFFLAEKLRHKSREAFDLLSQIPLSYRRFHLGEVDLRSATPVFSVDFEGRIQGVRFSERSAAPLDLPDELIMPMYQALRIWLGLLKEPVNRIRVLLQPGDFVAFDNQRVMHGRETFSGNRHLLYCQLDLDELHSRARVLEQRLGIAPAGLSMHRGT